MPWAIGSCPKAVANCVGTLELARSRVEVAVEEAAQLLDLGIYRVLPDGLREAVLGGGRGPLGAMLGRAWLAEPGAKPRSPRSGGSSRPRP